VKDFTSSGLDFLQIILNGPEVPVDELLAANLRYAAASYRDPGEFLQRAGRELAQLLRTEYPRLAGILRRCLAPSEVA
jgi:hypothetical protein